MDLIEFIESRKALLDDFAFRYERTKSKSRKSKPTMFRPEDEWASIYEEFLLGYSDGEDGESEAA